MRKTDKLGSKRRLKLTLPKRNRHDKAVSINKDEIILQQQKLHIEVNKVARQRDGQSVNWTTFGGIRGKLTSAPYLHNVRLEKKLKTHKMFSEK